MKSALFGCALSLLPGTAFAVEPGAPPPSFSWLGDARAISRNWAASRDTPTMNLTWFPRLTYVAGGEFALATWRRPRFTLRAGFAGLIELERDANEDGFVGAAWPSHDGKLIWRGAYAGYVAVAPADWGKRICASCGVEFALQYRHESEHYTGSNAGDAGEDMRGVPYVGDDLILDAALSEHFTDWYFAQRAYLLGYIPGQSSYRAGAAFDLHARYTGFAGVHPFTSVSGEQRFGTELQGRDFPDVQRLRGLFGVALPSTLGDILVYAFADVGNRYGVRALSNEATLGAGVRLALGRQPEH